MHSGCITGLKCDALNRILVSCSLDSTLKVWDFLSLQLNQTIKLDYPATHIAFNRTNNLMAYATSDMTLHVQDSITMKVI